MARIRRRRTSPVWSLVVWLYTRWRIALPIAAVIVAAIGTLDSFTDAGGTRILGALPFVVPGLLSLLHCLLILRDDAPKGHRVAVHFLTSAFVVALPVVVVNVLVLIGVWLIPSNQALVGPDVQNAWWPGTLLTQVTITLFGGIAGQIGGALVAFILVVLPVIAVRHPRVIVQGGVLAKIADSRIGKAAILSLVYGIAAAFIGGLMVTFTLKLDLSEIGYHLTLLVSTFAHLGTAPATQVVWAFGFLLVILGLAALVFTIVVASRASKQSGN